MTQSARLRPKLFTDMHPVSARVPVRGQFLQAPRPGTTPRNPAFGRWGRSRRLPMGRPRTSAAHRRRWPQPETGPPAGAKTSAKRAHVSGSG